MNALITTPLPNSGLHFWDNFEIGYLPFWRSHKVQAFLEHIDQAGGIYYRKSPPQLPRRHCLCVCVRVVAGFLAQTLAVRVSRDVMSYGCGCTDVDCGPVSPDVRDVVLSSQARTSDAADLTRLGVTVCALGCLRLRGPHTPLLTSHNGTFL